VCGRIGRINEKQHVYAYLVIPKVVTKIGLEMGTEAATEQRVGHYIGERLKEVGVDAFYCVPGDACVGLLEDLEQVEGLAMVNCSNELVAGYAADGHARGVGVGALVLTYNVGSLSALNAIAGAFAEDLPLVVICGLPSTAFSVSEKLLHHSLGPPDKLQQRRILREVSDSSVLISDPLNNHGQIDGAILSSIHQRKPVCIEVPSNVATVSSSALCKQPRLSLHQSFAVDHTALRNALDDTMALLSSSHSPAIVVGPRIPSPSILENKRFESKLEDLAHALDASVLCQPDAKGVFPESNSNHFHGIVWDDLSIPHKHVHEILRSSDVFVLLGLRLSDSNTLGLFALPHVPSEKSVHVDLESVSLYGTRFYSHGIQMEAFVSALIERLQSHKRSSRHVHHVAGNEELTLPDPSQPLDVEGYRRVLQNLLNNESSSSEISSLLIDTGDAWFNCAKLRLPRGVKFHQQLSYCSIGWSIGATLGFAKAREQEGKRSLCVIGDGAAQMTIQGISDLIRFVQRPKPIVFVLNNSSYGVRIPRAA
jgi:TPP-dependent 2-oxoacid decarboxylase